MSQDTTRFCHSPLKQVGPWRDLEGDRSSLACHFLHSHVGLLSSSLDFWIRDGGFDAPANWVRWILRCSIAHLKDILPGNNEKHCQHLGTKEMIEITSNHQNHQRWVQSSTQQLFLYLFIGFWIKNHPSLLLLPRCQGQVLSKNMDRWDSWKDTQHLWSCVKEIDTSEMDWQQKNYPVSWWWICIGNTVGNCM